MTAKHIVIYTRHGCEDSDAAREFLEQLHLPFEEQDVDENSEALRFVMSVNEGKKRTPTLRGGLPHIPQLSLRPSEVDSGTGLAATGSR